MAGKKTEDIVRCSFCNKTQSQVRKMIAGPNGTYICDDCVAICTEIIEEELDFNDRAALDDINLLTPEEMKAFLDEYVIGQDEAKKVLSVAENLHRRWTRFAWVWDGRRRSFPWPRRTFCVISLFSEGGL